MTDGYDLAIDFGTSNTSATIRRAGQRPIVLRLSPDGNLLPSAVLLGQGGVVVGNDAIRQARLRPEAFERTPKRRLGDPAVFLAGQPVPPEMLVAAVLERAYRHALTQARGEAPNNIILTHPQAWGPHRLNQLRQAARSAGLDPSRTFLVPEPIAAAWQHSTQLRPTPGQRIAVVDFGGGTFDVALLEIGHDNRSARVLAADGIDPLGGDDFDRRIEDWVLEQLRIDHPAVLERLQCNATADRLTLREEVRQAKHHLSHHSSADIIIPGEHGLVLTLTVREFEAMIGPDVDRAAALTRNLLGDSNAQVFLTGGSSQIPLVQRSFVALTGGRVGSLGDPKEATALGALTPPEIRDDSDPPPPPPPPPPPSPTKTTKTKLWLIPVGAVAVLLLIGLVFVVASPNRTAGGTTGGDVTPGVTPEVIPAADPTCGHLDSTSCAFLQRSIANEVDTSTCVMWPEGGPGVIACGADQSKATVGVDFFVYAYPVTGAAVESKFRSFYTSVGADPDTAGTDLTQPPSLTEWAYTPTPEKVEGLRGTLHNPQGESIWFLWSHRTAGYVAIASADASKVTARQLADWWVAT